MHDPVNLPASFQGGRDEALRLLFENAREYAIFLMDTDARVVHWNEGAERMLGWTEEEVVGRLGEIIFTPEQRARGVAEAEIERAKRDGRAEDVRWHLRKNGSRLWANGMMIALRDEEGTLRGLAKILRDETARKEAEDALDALRRDLEDQVVERTAQVRRLAGQLADAEAEGRRRAAAVLHDDVQQRLYGLHLGLGDVLRALEEADEAALAERLRRVRQWSGEALDLTRQLALDLAPPVERSAGMEEALEAIRDQAAERFGFRVRLDVADGLPALPLGTVALVAQAAHEAVFNAVKHAGVEEALLSAREAGGDVVVTIQDGGRGLGENRGRGMGHAGIEARMALAGGVARVDVPAGGGTVVTLRVPVTGRPSPPGSGSTRPPGA